MSGEAPNVDLKELENGPLVHRECRDVFCFILFLANIGAMLYCSYYAYTFGDHNNIFRGTDPDRRVCGLAPLQDYKYVYFTNPTLMSTNNRLCVKECPAYSNGTLSILNCTTNSQVGSCSYQYTVAEDGKSNVTIGGSSNVWGYDSQAIIDRVCIPKLSSLGYFNANTSNQSSSMLSNALAGGYLSNFISDIRNNWQVLLLGMLAAIVIAFIFMFLLRCIAGCVVWCSIVTTVLFLIGLGFILCYSGGLFGDGTFQYMGYTLPKIGQDQQYVRYYGFGVWGVALLLLFVVLCLCNRIRLAVAVCKQAGKFIMDVCSVVFVPVVMAVFTAALWTGCAVCMIYLVGATKFIANGDVFTSIADYADFALARFYYFIFATLWCNALLQALTIFIISSSCCMWYFSHGPGQELHLPVLRSLGRALWYHLGSLAFGSIMLALLEFLQLIVQLIKNQSDKVVGQTNKCKECCFNCLRCCLACIERIVTFINKNAYIQIALTGKNFCTAAKDGFQIVWSNPIRYAVVGGVGEVMMFLGKMLIACSTTTCVYLFITYSSLARVMSPLLFLLLVFVYSWAIGKVFMAVYSLAMDTLLVCFIVDETTQKETGGKGTAKYAPQELSELMDTEQSKK